MKTGQKITAGDVMLTAGTLMLCAGVWWIYPPAALIVFGVGLAITGIRLG